MSSQTSQDQEKIEAYLLVIEQRILEPLQETEVRRYCTATLLLLFAAIDGLGQLLHPNKNAGSGNRILKFLDYMGGDYRVRKRELLRLRNSLVHNAIADSFLSKTEMGDDQHLKKRDTDSFVHVNTTVVHKDFVDALAKFRADIKLNSTMMKLAADRLEWEEAADRSERGEGNPLDHQNSATPSPPPPVRFIREK